MSRLDKTTGRAQAREDTLAEVLLGALELPDGAAVLVVDDGPDAIGRELEARGHAVTRWWRMATLQHGATAWPLPGPYGAATIRLSKDKRAFEMAVHAALSVLQPGAPLLVYGANDEGIKSVPRRLEGILPGLETVEARRHCRVLETMRPSALPGLRGELDAWSRTETLAFGDSPVSHTVFPGVFAKGGLDEGTASLLATMPDPPAGASVLDFACGAGVIAGALQRRVPDLKLQLLDADAVSAEAARRNLPDAMVRIGASWSALPAYQRYDRIVSNPPIHSGKERDYSVLQRLIAGAPSRLVDEGELWMVLQRQVPVRDELWLCFDEVEEAWSNTRFRVWRAARPSRQGIQEVGGLRRGTGKRAPRKKPKHREPRR
ncbi:MAG: methyltransferase [Myxococcota bacterium]|nr:methyltransferase [Myxococcota bacterium]